MVKCTTHLSAQPSRTQVALHPGFVSTDGGKASTEQANKLLREHAAKAGQPPPPAVKPLQTPEESVSGLLRVLDRLEPKDSGSFFGFDGQHLPW